MVVGIHTSLNPTGNGDLVLDLAHEEIEGGDK